MHIAKRMPRSGRGPTPIRELITCAVILLIATPGRTPAVFGHFPASLTLPITVNIPVLDPETNPSRNPGYVVGYSQSLAIAPRHTNLAHHCEHSRLLWQSGIDASRLRWLGGWADGGPGGEGDVIIMGLI